MTINDAIYKLDNLFLKYNIKDKQNILGYRNNFMEYVKSLEGKDLQQEYNKKEFLYEFMELQKQIGLSVDLLNNYTMVLTSSNKNLGQCFTPDGLTELLSRLIVKNKKDDKIITFYDCAGGTGSTVIKAYYDWQEKQSFINSFNHIIEVDEYDLYNCYCCIFNIIIRGLNGIVRNKNTITNETFVVFIATNKMTYDYDFKWFSDYKTIKGEAMYEF